MSSGTGKPFVLVPDPEAAIEEFMHPDVCPGVGAALWARRHLNEPAIETHGVIHGDDAPVAEAEDALQVQAGVQGSVCQARLLCPDAETGVVAP